MPIRWRLTLLYSTVLLVVLALFGVSLYLLLNYSLTSELDYSINSKAEEILKSTKVVGTLPFFLRQIVLPDVEVFAGPDIYVQVVALDGEIAAKSQNLGAYHLPVEKRAAENVLAGKTFYTTVSVENTNLRMVIKPLLVDNNTAGFLQVARPLQPLYSALRILRNVLLLGSLGALGISLFLGWFLSGRALAPIRHITGEAKAIGEQGDFQRRVDYKGAQDELGELAVTFNHMLDSLDGLYSKLSASLAAQQRFVADASHELRTPLTSIQGNIDFLLQLNTAKEELPREALEDIASETRRISRLVKDLLTLARADSGIKLEMRPLQLKPVLEELVRQGQYLGQNHRFEADLAAAGDLAVLADADYIKQLLLIFFDNAFKFTPPGKAVHFKVEDKGEEIALLIRDEGPGIPESDQAHLFERFFRAQASRTGEGTGLGLSIAKWIADQHGARIEVESQQGAGTVFKIFFAVLR